MRLLFEAVLIVSVMVFSVWYTLTHTDREGLSLDSSQRVVVTLPTHIVMQTNENYIMKINGRTRCGV